MRTRILSIILITALAVSSCQKQIDKPNQSQAEETATRRGGPNKNPPVANAGVDVNIFLPVNSVTLNGSASDADNNITSSLWTKISGPSSFSIANANALRTQVTNLVQGVYQFELKVTDKTRLVDKDTVQVTVNAESTQPPSCTTCKIVFVSDRDGNDEIYSCNADGSNVTRLTNDAAVDGDPAWSPDGTLIAFIRNSNLYIMNADGSDPEQKTFTNLASNPAWSPDGTRIAFHDFYNGSSISVMNLTNGAISTIPNTDGSSVAPTPAWSPDGTKIAFDSDWNLWDFISDIFTISPQGSGMICLTPSFNNQDYWKPSWSPNGTKLSVTVTIPGFQGRSIGVMNADGTGLTIINTGFGLSEVYGEPRTSWSPDGTSIAYTDNKTIKWVAANGSASGTIIANGWDADWQH
ncbi:MAG TPA: DPP IV N-terminal domain-containing protein [Chitinophagaceae bacterium]